MRETFARTTRHTGLTGEKVIAIKSRTINEYVYQQFLDHVIGALGALSAQYQPVIDLGTLQVEYYEALLRISAPSDGPLYPDAFLALMDQFGVMQEITLWIIERALTDLTAAADARIFVNLAASCLGSEELLDRTSAGLTAHDVAPERLGFEIPCAALRERTQIEDWLARLADIGCRLAIDGCGAEDLTSVHFSDLAFDYVKFTAARGPALAAEAARPEIMAAVANLSQTGTKVVAVGIEDEAALAAVRAAGFRCGQGYHLGLPSPELRKRPHIQQ